MAGSSICKKFLNAFKGGKITMLLFPGEEKGKRNE